LQVKVGLNDVGAKFPCHLGPGTWAHLTYEPPSCILHPNLGRKFQHFQHAHIFLNVPSEVGSH
jgi:hypothetical protein